MSDKAILGDFPQILEQDPTAEGITVSYLKVGAIGGVSFKQGEDAFNKLQPNLIRIYVI